MDDQVQLIEALRRHGLTGNQPIRIQLSRVVDRYHRSELAMDPVAGVGS